ncbi:BQ5605_C001g00531 [Microbotryum silenes-dioicae]|uniref:BQ5605_C001g00531 protein n=1 Tax=Microbotryum silenes-dioicae TaxID=796604 RepID=A0A2X0P0B4_9BASI|nr:BQ5605_C001g00531 [Microbotryum silenes-dioicae]
MADQSVQGQSQSAELTSAQPARTHVCQAPGCTHSYARIEHLGEPLCRNPFFRFEWECARVLTRSRPRAERHARIHEPGHKYSCTTCGRGFARIDVLKRHEKLHQRDAESGLLQTNSTVRKQAALERTARACLACAASKVKCSGVPNCERCTNSGRDCVAAVEQSTDRQPSRKRARPGSLSASDVVEPSDYLVDPSIANTETEASLSLIEMALQPSDGFSLDTAPTRNFEDVSGHFPSVQTDHNSDFTHTLNSLFQPMLSLGPLSADDLADPFDTIFGVSTGPLQLNQDNTNFSFEWLGNQQQTPLWNSFTSPQGGNPPFDSGADGDVPSSQGNRVGGRVTLAPGGLATRHASPAADNERPPDRPWPMVWNPTEHDSQIEVDGTMPGAFERDELADHDPPSFLPMDNDVRMCILEALQFAKLQGHGYHAVFRTLANMSLKVYNHFISLYFTHVHRRLPMLHLPSFNPRKTFGLLLLSMTAIGALYAQMPRAHALGRILISVAKLAIGELTVDDNRHARSLPTLQANLLCSVAKWLGSARSLELTEVYRGTHTTALRRLGIFEDIVPEIAPDASIQSQWAHFIKYEERKRTAAVCFLLESEMTTLLHLPPHVPFVELQVALPCDEELWNAPTAERWNELRQSRSNSMQTQAIAKLITADTNYSLPPSIAISPLGHEVLVNGLHIMMYSARQLQQVGLEHLSEQAGAHVRKALSRLSKGYDEFSPVFGDNNNSDDDFTPAYVSYHMAHLASYLAVADLDAVAGRGSSAKSRTTTQNLIAWMKSNPDKARAVAVHSGQVVRRIRDKPLFGKSFTPLAPSSVFYAALCLHLYALSVDPLLSISPGPISTFPLDQAQQGEQVITWVAIGGYFASLQGVDCLAGSAAASQVLIMLAGLSNWSGRAWRIGHVLKDVLQAVASSL